MKKFLMFITMAGLLIGCGDVREEIEGIKWKDDYSKIGGSQAYTSFVNGEVRSCDEKDGKWRPVTRYEISNHRLTILADDKTKKNMNFDFKITGKGNERALIMIRDPGDESRNMTFPVSNNAFCPM